MSLLIALLLSFTFPVSADVLTLPDTKVPKVNLNFWNDDSSIQWNNNCYNYSTNRVTNSYAQPGEASKEIYIDLTCESVEAAASKDLGLELVKHFDFKNKDDDTLIALVIAPGWDFHWYRRDDNNYWSHKPGGTPATTKDQSGQDIESPETADRGYYTDFCGYFKIRNHITDASEQNAGYVRVGNMSELPGAANNSVLAESAEPSEVEILLYSGRKNPRLPLKSLLGDGNTAQQLKKWSQRLQSSKMSSVVLNNISRLGYNGLLIRDNEGIFFDKGSFVHITSESVVAHAKGRTVMVRDPEVYKLEQQLKKHFINFKN